MVSFIISTFLSSLCICLVLAGQSKKLSYPPPYMPSPHYGSREGPYPGPGPLFIQNKNDNDNRIKQYPIYPSYGGSYGGSNGGYGGGYGAGSYPGDYNSGYGGGYMPSPSVYGPPPLPPSYGPQYGVASVYGPPPPPPSYGPQYGVPSVYGAGSLTSSYLGGILSNLGYGSNGYGGNSGSLAGQLGALGLGSSGYGQSYGGSLAPAQAQIPPALLAFLTAGIGNSNGGYGNSNGGYGNSNGGYGNSNVFGQQQPQSLVGLLTGSGYNNGYGQNILNGLGQTSLQGVSYLSNGSAKPKPETETTKDNTK